MFGKIVNGIRRAAQYVAKKAEQLVAGAVGLVVTASAMATTAYDTLTAAVSFTDVGTAVFVVIAAAIGFSLLIGGGMIIWRLVHRAGRTT